MSQRLKLGIPKGLAPGAVFGDFLQKQKVTRSEAEPPLKSKKQKNLPCRHRRQERNFFMHKLHLSKRKLQLAKLLHYGGLALAIICLFFQSLLAFLGLFLFLIGILWLGSMFRCPQCGTSLFTKNFDVLASRPCDFCPKCGWKVDIEMNP